MNRPFASLLRPTVAIALIGWLALGATEVRAEDTLADQIRLESQATRQRKAEAARQTVRDLGLTPQQARRLLPIVDQAADLHVEAYEQEAELLPGIIEVFGYFALEDSVNQGFSPDVERQTAQLNRQAKEVRERISEQMVALEKQASAILTQAQRDYLAPHRPGRRVDDGNAPAADQDRLAAVRREMDRLHRQIHPQVSRLGQVLLHPAAAITLCEIADTSPSKAIRRALHVQEHGTEGYPLRHHDLQKAAVKELRDRISNWNLINGLHLDGEQIERIVALYDHVAPKVQEATKTGQRTSGGVNALKLAFERSVEGVLNAGQREVLAGFKPCLLPPKNLKDPVRIGQANDHSHGERWLERARKASDDRLAKLVAQTLEREAQRLGELSPTQRRQREASLLATAREAAAMSDVDFEINKAELAERVAPLDRIEALKTEIATLSRARGLPGPIARFMFDRQFIDQLRERGRQSADRIEPRTADLATGPQAETYQHDGTIQGEK